MKSLINRLCGWISLVLIVLYLTGCAPTIQALPKAPPIYLVERELSCLTPGTKQQIVAHNCKVDYDPAVCRKDKE